MISEKAGLYGEVNLERGRVHSGLRKIELSAKMSLADRRNVSKDGESCRDRCLIDARCDAYEESIRYLSMIDTTPFAKTKMRTAFEFSACRL